MSDTKNADLSSLRIKRTEDSSSEKKIRPVFLIVGIVAILLLAGYLFISDSFASAVEVELTSATLTYPSQMNAVLTASGYVVAQQKASVASKGAGRLVYLGVEEGDKVTKGQVIARLEDQDVLANLERARAELELANADLDDAYQTLERQQTMLTSGLTSKAEVDGAKARHNRVQAAIRSAEATVKVAEVDLENTRIRAPFDGTVLTKDADVGEIVAPFASSANSRGAVVTLADMSSLLVEADVSESNITRVVAGQPCEIVLDAYPEKRYQGVVHKIVPTADRAKATVLTKVRFKSRDESVLPEMSAKVTFLTKETDQAAVQAGPKLTVATSVVVNREGKDVVLLVRDGLVTEISVRVGERTGTRVEILEGVTQEDKLVARPTPEITTGSKVTIKK
ncbi:MAG: efflux RND transporter periplasmic adaptor subunit [Bacteroidota bacterium]